MIPGSFFEFYRNRLTDTLCPAAGEEPPDQQDPDPADHHEDLDFVHALLQEKERPRTLAGRSIGTRLTAAWRAVWDRRGVVTSECPPPLPRELHAD